MQPSVAGPSCNVNTAQSNRLIDHCISPGRSRIRSRSVWTPCARRRGRRRSGAYREPGRAAPADPSSTAASRRTSAPDPRRTLHNNTHAEGLVRTEITILSITLIGCQCFNLNLCSEGERRSYGFGTTRGWVTNVFWVNCPFKVPFTPSKDMVQNSKSPHHGYNQCLKWAGTQSKIVRVWVIRRYDPIYDYKWYRNYVKHTSPLISTQHCGHVWYCSLTCDH